MNKYEEALEHIEVNIDDFAVHFDIERSLNTIKELVNRATPMKPINQRNILGSLAGECVCGKATVFNTQNYCFYCGQALDWSDEK